MKNFQKYSFQIIYSFGFRFHSMMEKNTDDSHKERKRKKQINDSSDDRKVEKEKNRKNREKCNRYREKKKNEVAALPISGSSVSVEKKREEERKQKIREKTKRCRENKKKNGVAAVSVSGLFDSDEKKREKRKQKNREKTRRYRENKKNEIEVAALSMATTDSSSDSSGTKIEQARQKQINAEKCKRYRDNKRTSNLQKQNISNRQNVPQQIHGSQIATPSTRDVPYVPPVIHTSQIAGPSTRYVPYVPPVLHSSTIAGPSSRDVPYIPSSHSNKNSPIHSIEDRVLQSHPPSQIDPPPPNINLQTYSAFQQNSSAHREFEKDFVENEFAIFVMRLQFLYVK